MSMFLGFNLSRVEVVTARFGRKIAFVTLQKPLADELIKKYNGKSCSFGVLKVELKTSPKRRSEYYILYQLVACSMFKTMISVRLGHHRKDP